MDPYEATKVVFSRIQVIDPENASKIMGLLLIQDHGEKEMIRLAFGPENQLHSLVVKARQELGIPPNTPSNNINININHNHSISRQNSSSNNSTVNSSTRFLPNGLKVPSSLTIPTLGSPSPNSSPSWGGGSGFSDDLGSNNKSCSSTLNPSTPPFYCNSTRSSSSRSGGVGPRGGGGAEMMDEFQLREQLSFLNDSSSSPTLRPKSSDLYYSQSDLLGSNGGGDSILYNGVANAGNWGGGSTSTTHRRSCSVSDINLGSSMLEDPSSGLGWKPCLYYARGFCKNGSSCRFVHGGGGLSEAEAAALVGSPSKFEMMEQCHELLRSKSMQHQKLIAAIASGSCSGSSSGSLPGSPSFPYSMNKGLSLFAQHHQNDSPRAAAAAAALLMEGDLHKLSSRSPRGLDNCRDSNPASRQIYLTFPADSTFREEDVSSYFSIYGPVQDVRIPYQQKRMFGFVTFMYPDTVKIILAKGNPHFVCDARVLVKPYKEKGKVPDKFRKQHQQQQMERGEFSSCGSPTGVDSRDLFDPPIGGRMMHDTQYMLWRRKLEEQADLQVQQAIELQSRRLMGLQLLDVKRNHHHHRSLSTGAPSIFSPSQSPNSIFHQTLLGSDRSSPDASDEICVSPPLNEAKQALQQAINEATDREKEGSVGGGEDNNNVNCKESLCHEDNVFDFPESLEHDLPDSPFASAEKAADEFISTFPSSAAGGGSYDAEVMSFSGATSNNSKVSSYLASSPALDMAPFKSCYFQMPRFSPGHGAIGM